MQDPYSYVDVSKLRYTPKSQHREPSREDAMKGRPLETADGYIMTSHCKSYIYGALKRKMSIFMSL